MFIRYKIRHASSLESSISFYVCFVTGNSKTVTVPWKRCVLMVHVLLCFPSTVGLTYICTLALTPAVILQAWQVLIQTCTQTQLLFISSSMFVWYSFMRAQSSQKNLHLLAHLQLKLAQIAWQPACLVLSITCSALLFALSSWLFWTSAPIYAVSAPRQLVCLPNLCPLPSPLSPWPTWN